MANRKQKKEMTYYFAYGSNMNHEHMKYRCPKSKYIGTYELPDHKLVFRSVADVQKSEDSSVVGALFKITDECERSLDRYEGYPNLYTKKYHTTWDKNTPMKIMFYSMVDKQLVYPPAESYLETIIRGYMDCDLPTEALEEALQFSVNRLD
jgi:gamma-glutamylcyclotransferase (GGCT)/AIG2-like uncharacterized protein YtfP